MPESVAPATTPVCIKTNVQRVEHYLESDLIKGRQFGKEAPQNRLTRRRAPTSGMNNENHELLAPHDVTVSVVVRETLRDARGGSFIHLKTRVLELPKGTPVKLFRRVGQGTAKDAIASFAIGSEQFTVKSDGSSIVRDIPRGRATTRGASLPLSTKMSIAG